MKANKEQPVCEDLDAAADKYESEQQEKYKDRDNHDFDNYRDGFVDGLTLTYDAFKAGAQWQKERMIEKAGNWIGSHLLSTSTGAYYLEEFKKVMQQ